jgi:very-short-patch-repair endonuclease
MNKRVFDAAKEVCRELRKKSTLSEKLMWAEVRNRKFHGKKFFRQHPLFFSYMNKNTFLVADFYCSEASLVVEIDGKSHDYQKEYDALRTYIINDMGINVVRFKNKEVEKDLPSVLKRLEDIIKANSPRNPSL